MEVKVGLAPFGVHKDYVSGFWVCNSGSFFSNWTKEDYFVQFLMRSAEF